MYVHMERKIGELNRNGSSLGLRALDDKVCIE